MYLNNLNLSAFREGCREGIQKKAGFASAIGSGLEWLAPDTTNNFLRPAWHGVKKEFSNPNWSIDSVMNAAGKGVEANRFANIEKKVSPYGVTFNKDQYGALDTNNPLDLMGSIKNMGSNAWNWAKTNPGQLLGGAAAVGGIGYLLNSIFNSSNKKQAPQPQQVQYIQPSYANDPYSEYGVTAMDRYKSASAHNLDIRKYLTLQGAAPLAYNFATKLPQVGARNYEAHDNELVTSPVQDINVSSDDKVIKKLLQKQEMRDYILKLMQPR